LENLPEGPAVLIFYHGVPVDYYLLVLRIYRLTGRFCYSTVDHAVFTIPGLKIFLHAHRVDHPTREECVEILKEGNLLGIGPGGVREQNYGDNNYKLIWRKRKGFADVAIKAKVTKAAVESLRDRHQKIPGSIWRALKERFDWLHKYE
uniref:Phospholipid/glycerol acyltransferase domain-containing protein n=1 Tax=Salvator merianae TaxID=96440 RepID=A0A8D0BUI7_SALMN